MSERDPIHAAASAYAAAHATVLQAVCRYDTMAATLSAGNAIGPASVDCSVAGPTIKLRSHRAIDRLFRRAREGQEAESTLALAEQRLRDDLDKERQRIAGFRSSINAPAIEEALESARLEARSAYLAAVRTVPTSLAGLRVLAGLIARPPANDWNLIEPARRSLDCAATALLPENTP